MNTATLEQALEEFAQALPRNMRNRLKRSELLWRYTTLRVGGPADLYFRATKSDDLAEVAAAAQRMSIPYFLLGGGSNVCISDRGVRGLVLHNDCRRCDIGLTTHVDCGYSFMQLFLDAARESLSGLEFAVGIPGSVGAPLGSNAGPSRQN